MAEYTDVSDWLTVEQVAKRLGLSEDRIRRLIRRREIVAFKIGQWLIRPQDLSCFISSRMNVKQV